MSEIMVEVTADDIENGIQSDPCLCPVALALARAEYDNPYVGLVTFSVGYVGTNYRSGYMSYAATQFIRAFDEGEPVEPTTFALERSEETVNADD